MMMTLVDWISVAGFVIGSLAAFAALHIKEDWFTKWVALGCFAFQIDVILSEFR